MLTETTIGGHFDLVNSTLEEIVVTISDGEFDPTFLSRYQHGDQLKECCVLAVDRLAADPFAGRVTCAHLMGRAMELLRHSYDLNAPRGWVPVIRTLRSPLQFVSGCSLPSTPAEELLTDPFSGLAAIDSRCEGVLCAYANRHPEFMEFLVELARK